MDLLAFTEHKGLLGPQGTGGFYISKDIEIEPLIRGGTGSKSDSEFQPEFFPDKYESETINAMGLAFLSASLNFILKNKKSILHYNGRFGAYTADPVTVPVSVWGYTPMPFL